MNIHRLLTGILCSSVTVASTLTDCRLPGVLYQGTKNVTETGRPCQRWDMQSPHEHSYDAFSTARENYCRNFDREEPWCFTNDSDVRWELCGMDICETPCLNQSFYTEELTTQCLSTVPGSREHCSYVSDLVSCFKKNVENLTSFHCSQMKWRSIALQIQGTIEEITGKSISECVLSPCRDPRVIENSLVVIKFAVPCYKEFFKNVIAEALCRVMQRIVHCVISQVHKDDETNSICLVKDKFSMANRFLSLVPSELQYNASLCVKNFFSEFPLLVENTAGTSTLAVDQEGNSDLSQTTIFTAVGFALLFIFAVSFASSIYKIRAITLRKRRKELMRLPTIPEDPAYEDRLTYLDGLYLDPDYETIEEQDEGYEQLSGPGDNHFTPSLSDGDGPYTDPNNADGTYLDVVHDNTEPNEYINVSPYLDLEDDTIDDQLRSEGMDILLSETSETITIPDNIDET